ncbi:MAG: septal ring lytic transglycosylase RlpA family lipoprotein [Nitrospirae bacterium CG18_big_fil_WC_8_21_14_2_50_70_55]|nr:septal ring lytic transglycosylase RlpA family protein [Deltaproteobacteria bacterium]OIP63006.1 MAG: hypothetical protein AUK30_09165 [Nitrospirae bacterium CG2_30_70_394]PIQ05320.1 MAG: septal ring lytic transglycosylase RlpA family lipoprotein [Nitrospirae bacterium CG18_big_fil_WC_8_21_14_2_50_70_55]PIU79659.1 MAG: septal ring lytic transglycosylase RlpA family lipoprotein [Nitrospirae bacterium CG06_land_8_20_14_3_00_70_43]PIW82829.1 MAG: septal ring lytic transglycosylase RlpA family l
MTHRHLTVLLLLLAFAACHLVRYERPGAFQPMERVEPGWTERGVASWYGRPFHGRPTASGETFDMDRLSCAHKTLPLGTVVRVTNLATGQKLDLRVNDRGPYIHGRIIDCSRAAARSLGFFGAGITPVEIEVVSAGAGPTLTYQETASGGDYAYTLQLGAFSDLGRARALAQRLVNDGVTPRIEAAGEGSRRLYRVRAGRYPSKDAADQSAATLYAQGYDIYLALAD